MKRIVCLILVLVLITGCSSSEQVGYKEALAIKPIELDDSNSGTLKLLALSKADREKLIYNQVSSRNLIDVESLDTVSEEDTKNINDFMSKVIAKIGGSNNESLPDDLLNYLLFEMEKTPYNWMYDKSEIIGIDSSSRSFIVDLTYKTYGNKATYDVSKSGEGVDVVKSLEDKANKQDTSGYTQETINGLQSNIIKKNISTLSRTELEGLYKSVCAILKACTENLMLKCDTSLINIKSEIESAIVNSVQETDINTYSKVIKRKSTIPLGSQDYDTKMKVRLKKYTDILHKKKQGDESYKADLDKFTSVYGSIKEILEGQVQGTLSKNLFNGKLFTYENLVDSDIEQSGATMTIRFVLNYKYALGINQGLYCQHLYVKDYKLDNNPLSSKQPLNSEQTANIIKYIDTLIYSLNKCVDENNFIGLNSLIDDFGKYDKYYNDMFNISYTKMNGYAIDVYSIENTLVTIGVTRVRKTRAKGSNMSYPVYEEQWYYQVELSGDKLVVKNEVLLDSKLISEPLIATIASDGTNQDKGFENNIAILDNVKEVINEKLKNLSKLQIESDSTSKNFSNTVDLNLGYSELVRLKENMFEISGIKEKAIWLKNYNSAYKGYVSLTLLEVFTKEDGTALECESVVSFVQKNSKWYITEYSHNTINNINKDNVEFKSALDIAKK